LTLINPHQPAPDFAISDQNGNIRSLSEFSGKWLALYFYPRDLTATCTVQACNLRDNFDLLTQNNVAILGVSNDDAAKHLRFMARNTLPFDLLCDTDHSLSLAYGVWGEKKFMGKTFDGLHRTTFIIDPQGIVQHIIRKPKSKIHAAEILDAIFSYIS
jgi:thioredoxin-dependent peroxiredoxin